MSKSKTVQPPDLQQLVKDLVDSRFLGFLDYDVFIGNDGGTTDGDDRMEAIVGTIAAEYEDVDELLLADLRQRAHFLVGLELGRRVGAR